MSDMQKLGASRQDILSKHVNHLLPGMCAQFCFESILVIISMEQQFLKHIPTQVLSHELLSQWQSGRWFLQQSCFWSASLWDVVGGVDESLDLLMDLDLWFKFASNGTSISVDHNLAAMRYYSDVKTRRSRIKFNEELAYIYAKNKRYPELRRLVLKIDQDKEQILSQLQRLEFSLPVRVLKRLSLLDKNYCQ